MDERKRYCENCGVVIISDSIYCARCELALENVPLPVSRPPKQKKSRNWLIGLVVVLLVVSAIDAVGLVGYLTASTGSTDYSSYYNNLGAAGWTITFPFVKGTDSNGNAAYMGVMRNESGNYSLSYVIHIFDTENEAKNDYSAQVTHSISQGYTTADLSQLGGSEIGGTRMGAYVSAEWGSNTVSGTFVRIALGHDNTINKWVVCSQVGRC